MEFLAGIWAMAVVFATGFWGLLFLGLFVLWLVHEESDGWAIFWMLIWGTAIYFAFQLTWMQALIGAAAYIPIGILWSMHRWKRHCKKKVASYKEDTERHIRQRDLDPDAANEHRALEKEDLARQLEVDGSVTRLARWVVIWPFSMIDHIVGDLWDAIVTLIQKHLVNVYKRIATNAMKDLD